MNFWNEIRRRHVVQVALIYLAAAWGAAQVADLLLDNFDAPHWIFRFFFGVLVAGFPVVMAVAWAFELRGLSLIPQQAIDDKGAGVVIIPPTPPHEKSIAVLPFVNMSGDEDNEYFSDGISEELLNLLAKVNDLKVISRSSAFSFKGKDVPLREIAARLNCANVLEGSVRKMGNQVRITAQLIQAETDTHLWSETYDRTLEDIFKVQDEIAAMVVEELKAKLLGAMPKVRETDPALYALYLQAHHLSNQHTKDAMLRSIELCEGVLARDPNYVPAWICLGRNKSNLVIIGGVPDREGLAEAKRCFAEAIELEPDNAKALSFIGWNTMDGMGDLQIAATHLKRAMEIAPRDEVVLRAVAVLFQNIGRIKEARTALEIAIRMNPVDGTSQHNMAEMLFREGNFERAITFCRAALELSPNRVGTHSICSRAYLLEGKADEALAEIEQEPIEEWRKIVMPMILHLLGRQEQKEEALNELIRDYADKASYDIACVHAYSGQPDNAFEWLKRAVETNESGLAGIASEPLVDNIRDDPRWVPFMRKIGRAPEQLAQIKFDIRLAEEKVTVS